MQRLADVEYRLVSTGESACTTKGAVFGMRLDFIGAYEGGDREAVAHVLKMSDRPQIAAVAAGSPADMAGLRPGDDVLAIDGEDTLKLLTASSRAALFADDLEELLLQHAPDVATTLMVRRDGVVFLAQVRPTAGCATRVLVKTGLGITAFTDGANIAVSSELVRFALNNDELALIVGHELGHIIRKDGEAGSLRQRRDMEDRADALGIGLAKCAGYDAERSLQFWLRRDAQDWLRLLRDPTHRSRKGRVLAMREAATVAKCPVAL